jgi:hypothetical protein
LKETEDDLENGRKMVHAIKVRSYFNNESKLGPTALKLNNPFFGNSPIYVNKLMSNPMLFPTRMTRCFIKPTFNQEYVTLITSLFSELSLSQFNETGISHIVQSNLRTFQDLIQPLKREVKGDMKAKKSREKRMKLPNNPGGSPLYLKEEMSIIHSIFSNFWMSLDQLKKEYEKEVLEQSFATISNRVQTTIKCRWSILTKFSTASTNRLLTIRRGKNDTRLKKRAVVQDDVKTLASCIRISPDIFYSEIYELFKGIDEDNFSLITNKMINSRKELSDLIHLKIHSLGEIKPKQSVDEKAEEIRESISRAQAVPVSLFPKGTKKSEKSKVLAFYNKDAKNLKKTISVKNDEKEFLLTYERLHDIMQKDQKWKQWLQELLKKEHVTSDSKVDICSFLVDNWNRFKNELIFQEIFKFILDTELKK